MRIRPELRNGIILLVLVLLMAIVVEALAPNPIRTTEYSQIDSSYLLEQPILYEGQKITLRVTVESIEDYNTSDVLINTIEGVVLLCNMDIVPQQSSALLVRGICKVQSLGYVETVEFYQIDALSSPLRSIPGIVLFMILFFYVFRFRPRELLFIPRGDDHA